MSFSWLDDTGKSNETFAVGEGIQDVLIEWGNEVIDKLQASLIAKQSSNTTLNLYSSLVVLPIELGDSKFTLKFQAEDYWKFINEGVQGAGDNQTIDGRESKSFWTNKAPQSPYSFKDKRPPVNYSNINGQSLAQWAHNKGINKYAVQESIFRSGIKPTHFWDDVINQNLVKDLVKRLEKAGAKEVELVLSKDFK